MTSAQKKLTFEGVFYALFAIALYQSVFKYGCAQGAVGSNSDHFRVIARYWILGSSLIGIFALKRDILLPRAHPIAKVCFIGLLLWGGFMVSNAQYDIRMFEFILNPIKDRPFPDAPGSFTLMTSRGYLIEVLALFVLLAMIARSVESDHILGVLGLIALTGALVTITGLLHKMIGWKAIWNAPGQVLPETYFAPFVYNANAAAFLNLTTMVALGLAFHNLVDQRKGKRKTFSLWLTIAGICALGVLASASKAGAAILVAQFGCFLVLNFTLAKKHSIQLFQGAKFLSTEKKLVIGSTLLLFLIFAVSSADLLITRVTEILTQMDEKGSSSTIQGRIHYIGIMKHLIATPDEVDWHGFGPGSFGTVMFWFREISPGHIVGRTDYGHCDPLQTIVEWGYPGAFFWFVLGAGAIVRGFYLITGKRVMGRDRALIKALMIGVFFVGLHSCFDLPLSIFAVHLIAVTGCCVLWCFPTRALPAKAPSQTPETKV